MDETSRSKASCDSLRYKWTLAVLLLSMSSACASLKPNETIKTFNIPSAQAETAMSETIERPSLSPEEIKRRLLKFAESINGPSDFTIERYKQIMQLPLESFDQEERLQDFVENISGSSWKHTLSFSNDPLAETRGLSYTLESDEWQLDGPILDMQPVCGMGFDAFRQGLLSIGYSEGPSMPERIGYEPHGLLNHTFSRNDIIVDLLTQGGGVTGQKMCIMNIDIWASNA